MFWRFIFCKFLLCLLQYCGCWDFKIHLLWYVHQFTSLALLTKLNTDNILFYSFRLPSLPSKSPPQPYLFLVLLLIPVQPIQFSSNTKLSIIIYPLSILLSSNNFHPMLFGNSWLLTFVTTFISFFFFTFKFHIFFKNPTFIYVFLICQVLRKQKHMLTHQLPAKLL